MVRKLLKHWLGVLTRHGQNPEAIEPKHVGLWVVLTPLTLLGGGKGKKGTVGAKAGEKAGKALLAKILKKLLLKVTRTLVKLGLKVTGWTLAAFIILVAFPLTAMALAFWRIAHRAYRHGSASLPRGLVLVQLQLFAVPAGIWCAGAPLPILFGHLLAGPLLIVGAVILLTPPLLIVRAHRRRPLKYPIAEQTIGLHLLMLPVAIGLAGLIAAPFVALVWGVLYGEAVSVLSLAVCSIMRALITLRASRLTRRLWLPADAVPS